MAKFTPFSKSDRCPICDRHDDPGRCRQGEGELILCMTLLDAVDVPGYRFAGLTKDRTWGQWVPDDRSWTEEQRQRHQDELEARRQARAAAEAKRRAEALPAAQRDREYRRILASLTLHSDDRADLERRGFTAEQIERGGFKSVEQWQRLQQIADHRLAGVNLDGASLNVQPGYLCPIYNVDGQLVAFQNRQREDGGYRWLSSPKNRPNGPTAHNEDGELPLAVFEPASAAAEHIIGLAEGTGAKPFLASDRLGIPVIGAAGAQWASSPKTFRRTLDKLSARHKANRVVLYADAGMLDKSHKSVRGRYRATIALLESWGYEVVIAWWGQTEKSHGDIDEISDYSQIRYISIEEFSALANDEEKGRTHNQWEAYKQQKRLDWLEQRTEQARASWRRRRNFIPSELVEQRYLDLNQADCCNIHAWADGELVQVQGEHCDLASRVDIHALKSTMGTGKTEELVRILAQLREMGAIAIGSRNSLLIGSCVRWGNFEKWGIKDRKFHHLHQDNAHGLILKSDSRVACCFDSLVHFRPEDFDGKIVILDELVSIIKHGLLSETLKDRRQQCLDIFEQAIKRAALVIAWDGNNADIAVNYLANLRGPDARVLKLLNQFKGDRLNVELVQAVDAEGKALLRDKSPVERKLKDALAAALHLPASAARSQFVISDNQRQLEALDENLSATGYKILRIDSKTTASKEGKELLKNISQHLAERHYDAVLLSPTGESGVDINIQNYFAHGFGFFCGVLDTDTQMQFLRRARACLNWTVWCQEYTLLEDWEGTRSPFARRLQAQLLDYLQQDAIAALEGDARAVLLEGFIKQMADELNSPHAQTALQFMASRNFERSHTRECLEYALTEAGHQVKLISVAKDEIITEEMKAARAAIIDADSSKVFNAPPMSAAVALKIKSSFSANEEERYAAEKALLVARLPGIDQTPVWSTDLVKRLLFTESDLLKRLERYWMLRHMDAAQERSRLQWARVMDEGNFFSLDIQTDLAMLRGLQSLELLEIVDEGEALTADSEAVERIYQRCKRSKALQTALRRAPGKLGAMDWLGRLMRLIGVSRRSKLLPRDSAGDRTREYTYMPPEPDEVCAAILGCYQKRFDKYLQPESAETTAPPTENVDHLGEDKVPKQPEGDPCQEPTTAGIEPKSQNTPFPSGQRVRWGTSMAPWEVLSCDGSVARVRICDRPGWATELTAPIEELIAV